MEMSQFLKYNTIGRWKKTKKKRIATYSNNFYGKKFTHWCGADMADRGLKEIEEF